MQALSHAFAKAAMFLSAGLIAESLGHDRIAGLGGAARAMPVTFLALGLGGLSLMGLPPSGGFAAKWLLMKASVAVRPVGMGGRHGGGRTAGGRLSLPGAGPGAFGRKPATEEGARSAAAKASRWLWRLSLCCSRFAPPAFFAFLQIGRPAAGLALQ